MFPNPLNLFWPRTPQEAAARAEKLQQRGQAYTGQVAEMIGTFGTAFGRLLSSIGSAPFAGIGKTADVLRSGIETIAYPFGLVGQIMHGTRMKLNAVLGQEWGSGWQGRVKTALAGT